MNKIRNDMVDYKRPVNADDIITNGGGGEWVVGIARIGNGPSAMWKHINDKGYELTLDKPFFDSHPAFGGIEQNTIDGQHMVKVPKYYYKVGNSPSDAPVPNCKTRWISPTKVDDTWDCHPAFYVTAGEEIPYFYVGAFEATVDGSKMGSIGAQSLMVRKAATEYINLANARNVNGVTGFKVVSIYEWSAIAWLCHIEMKGGDSQSLIAPGHADASEGAPNDALERAASYRGIYGLCGNFYQYVTAF